MVYRVYVEKKPPLQNEARKLLEDARTFLGLTGLTQLRLLNRYDAQGLTEALFDAAVRTVFSEPQVDDVRRELPRDADRVLAVEYLPGQYDQRADSAAQCIQILSQGERPTVRTAKVYLLYGAVDDPALEAFKRYVINPVECREAALAAPRTLDIPYARPGEVPVLTGFRALAGPALTQAVGTYGLAMDADDLRCCRDYFAAEGRDPTLTELRVLDTYWSDHCRHTTFNTVIDAVEFEDETLRAAYDEYLTVRRRLGRDKPVTFMDLGTLAAKALRAQGKLEKLDESHEINACTVKITVHVGGEAQPWLLLFKNETHNHPTEIEPFGGAATCIGGAIRDPLSGRSYVYAAMRVTGGADPLRPLSETLPGKLPQRKLVTSAAAGYSSYGNQIGLATGLVDELYHDGYAAKRMEIGAVLGAAPAKNVRRETPVPGDVVILLGGRTGRDGMGGATGSSKAHTVRSLETCGAQVQKGNAPEERKLQRLFRNGAAARLIKRCNDFGAGGVSVAVGELADGLSIDLDAVPKKYEGLDGTELAISESQERMAVVVAAADADAFCALAREENLETSRVAVVTHSPRLTMRWNGKVIADVSRAFLDTNGAPKHITVRTEAPKDWAKPLPDSFSDGLRTLAGSLSCCSRRGLAERFDATIGSGTVLMPFGGRTQSTPIQAMAHKLPAEHGETDDCSVMAWGGNPEILEKSPYHGAYMAVAESIAKLIAAGAPFRDVYLSFQEYFEKPGRDPKRWGRPLSALLGAFRAQMDLGVAAIGGKDSMSGSFEKLDVPPTLVSFAVTTAKTGDIVSDEFKAPGHRVVLLAPQTNTQSLPQADSLKALFEEVHRLMQAGVIVAAYTPGAGGAAEAVMKMCFGNRLGFTFDDGVSLDALFCLRCGAFVAELSGEADVGVTLGCTTAEQSLRLRDESVPLEELFDAYEAKLAPVYPCEAQTPEKTAPIFTCDAARKRPAPAVRRTKPRVLIPVFPGTNCEYDSARAFELAGAEPKLAVIRNLTAADIAHSVRDFARDAADSQIIFIPGGFSGGDEPDGSAKFITAFFRSPEVRRATQALLDERGGLMAGVCNGFQALIKLGLVPWGRIVDADESCPTLTYNAIGRHQSRLVRTRVASNSSPWLANTVPGEIYTVPVSHGEGRFWASPDLIAELAQNGQISTQYADENGVPSMDISANPNGSACAVEGITSPDGRVLGKMGHSERIGDGLYKNVPGRYDMGLFRAAAEYFR